MHDITVTDPKVTGITCPKTALTAGESMTCTADPYATTAADAERGYATNTARVAGLVDDPTDPDADPQSLGGDSNTVIVPGVGALAVQKSADAASFAEVGDEIAYTFEVTNTGTAPVHDITVTDPKVSGITCPKTELKAGESMTCTADPYPTTAADAARGYATNTAKVAGLVDDPTDPDADPDPIDEDSDPVITPGKPGLTVAKKADNASFVQVGDEIAYTFEVTNTGTTPVHDLALTDPKVTGITCPKTTLAPAESMTCTADPYPTTAADAERGYAVNTAHLAGLVDDPTDPEADPTPIDQDSNKVITPGTPGLSVHKTADSASFAKVGDPIAYNFEVANTGTAPIHDLAVTDPKVTGITCPKTALNAGESMTCTADPYPTTAADADRGYAVNQAKVAGLVDDPRNPDADPTPIDQDSNKVITPGVPALNVHKSSDASSFTAVGDTITYWFEVDNTGTAPVHDITLTDPKVTGITCPKTTLGAGEQMTCTADPYATTAADADRGYAVNQAKVAGLVDDPRNPDADPTPVDEDSNEAITPGTPGLSVHKTADVTSFAAVGDPIAYTFEVANTGTTPVHHVAVTDPKVTGITCPRTTLGAGESMTCTADPYATTAADAARGYATNTAHVAGTVADPRDPGTDPKNVGGDSNTVVVPGKGALAVHKTADATSFAKVGDSVAYAFAVTNTGTGPVDDITVTDPKVAGITCPKTTLAAGATMTCTAEPYTTTMADARRGYAVNTAHVTGTVVDPIDPEAEPTPIGGDSNTVTTPGAPRLTVVKHADAARVAVGKAIRYTFDVTNTGAVTVRGVRIDDPLLTAAGTSVTCPRADLDPGESQTCAADRPYTPGADQAKVGKVTNVATATGTYGIPDPDGEPGRTPTGTVTSEPGRATVVIVDPADPNQPARPRVIGPLAFTGADVPGLLGLTATLLLLGGLALALAIRSRRRPCPVATVARRHAR